MGFAQSSRAFVHVQLPFCYVNGPEPSTLKSSKAASGGR